MNDVIKELESYENVEVVHQIDATIIDSYAQFKNKHFTKVMFNFPCIAGQSTSQDAQLNEIEPNQQLMK